MFFEVLNSDGKTVFNTSESACLPRGEQIKNMLNIGYKFRVDNKILTKKALNEFMKQEGL